MSAAIEIDALRFARLGERLEGELAVTRLTRLADLIASDRGQVRYRLRGGIESGRPTLVLRVEAELEMVCQRCLEVCAQHVQSESRMPLARNEAEMRRWECDEPLLDVLLADSALDVLALVEDEVLLSLPLVARHPEGQCAVAAKTSDQPDSIRRSILEGV